MFDPIGELDTGADNKIDHGARDEQLARLCDGRDLLPDVNGEPGDIRVVGYLDLTGVQPRTDTEAQLADSISDRAGDGAGGRAPLAPLLVAGGWWLVAGGLAGTTNVPSGCSPGANPTVSMVQ